MRFLSFILAAAVLTAAPAMAIVKASPTPSPAMHSMKSGAMKSSAMKGSAMKGSAMKGGAMKGGAMKSNAMKSNAMKASPNPKATKQP